MESEPGLFSSNTGTDHITENSEVTDSKEGNSELE
jgi:hypothetical protein